MLTAAKGAAFAALALLVVVGGVWAYGYFNGRASEEYKQKVAEAERLGVIAEAYKDSTATARAALLNQEPIIREILVRAPVPRAPDRPEIPVALDSLTRDSLTTIIGTQDRYIDTILVISDTLRKRLVEVTAILDTTFRIATRYQTFADSTINAQARQIVAMQVVIDTPRPRKPWGIGVACGYGAVVSQGMTSGPGCTAGVTFSIGIPWFF